MQLVLTLCELLCSKVIFTPKYYRKTLNLERTFDLDGYCFIMNNCFLQYNAAFEKITPKYLRDKVLLPRAADIMSISEKKVANCGANNLITLCDQVQRVSISDDFHTKFSPTTF